MSIEKKLSEYSDKELSEMYHSYVLRHFEGKDISYLLKTLPSRQNHDIWNAYRYGDMVKIVYINSRAPIKKKKSGNIKPFEAPEDKSEERFSQSLSRAKQRIFELAMCNEFTYFCTFTQSEEKRDRFDLTEFRKDLAQFVRNKNRSRSEESKIRYVLIPEEHKNGGWHMHGLLSGLSEGDLRLFDISEKLPYKILEKLKKGEKIYNWDDYSSKFGYFTCTPIKSKISCAKYITKYITKDLQKSSLKSGQHLFFASQGLKGRETLVYESSEKCPVSEWDYKNQYISVKEFSLSEIWDSETGEIRGL